MSATATSGSEAVSKSSIFDDMFEHCHMDNPIYVQGMFWIGVFIVTYIGTLYYKCKEKREAAEAEMQKNATREARLQKRLANAPLIEVSNHPLRKRIEVPVVEVAQKAMKVPKDAPKNKKPEPVQMVE